MSSQRATLLLALCAAFGLTAFAGEYRSATVDAKGRLHIVSDTGKETVVAKTRYQTSFGGPEISPDRQTVVWKVMSTDPSRNYFSELAFAIGVFRNGRVAHIFPAEPTLWDWQFQEGGARIAYVTGPTHGGAAETFLRDVVSGRLLDQWTFGDQRPMPDWAAPFTRLFPTAPVQ